jgi:uncharacterized integral membrane protein (TIGR00697 family)
MFNHIAMQRQKDKGYKFLPLFSMLYLTIMLSSLFLIHKTITVLHHDLPAAVFVFPIWFILGDIIAEVYGYAISKKMVFYALISQLLFIVIVVKAVHMPSPDYWNGQAAYIFVTASWLKIYLSVLLGIIAAGLVNAYCISKWKILLKGKYFWLRSIGASGIGEIIYSFLFSIFAFYGSWSDSNIFKYTVMSFSLKLLYSIVLAYPANLIVFLLNKAEGNDPFNFDIKIQYEKAL